MRTPEDQNRQTAKMAVRSLCVCHLLSNRDRRDDYMAAGLSELDASLLSEADATDYWTGTQDDMLKLLRAEYAKLNGQKLGGHVTAIKRKHAARHTD